MLTIDSLGRGLVATPQKTVAARPRPWVKSGGGRDVPAAGRTGSARADRPVGAGGLAGGAIDALLRIDRVYRVLLGNRPLGAGFHTRAARDAVVGVNLVSHRRKMLSGLGGPAQGNFRGAFAPAARARGGQFAGADVAGIPSTSSRFSIRTSASRVQAVARSPGNSNESTTWRNRGAFSRSSLCTGRLPR